MGCCLDRSANLNQEVLNDSLTSNYVLKITENGCEICLNQGSPVTQEVQAISVPVGENKKLDTQLMNFNTVTQQIIEEKIRINFNLDNSKVITISSNFKLNANWLAMFRTPKKVPDLKFDGLSEILLEI